MRVGDDNRQATVPVRVVPPVIQHDVGYWDTLGAFHDNWNGVYFKGYYHPPQGHAPYPAEMPKDAPWIIPAMLRPVFQAQQEALKFHVPNVHSATAEWRAVRQTGRALRPPPTQVQGTRPPSQMVPQVQATNPPRPMTTPVQATRPSVGPFSMGHVPVRPPPVDTAQQKLETL